MKTTTIIVSLTAFAGLATAQLDVGTGPATGSAEIRNDGVRLFGGDVSTAFWNVQPAGQFATVGVMQFDASAIAAAAAANSLNSVADVRFSLFQDPAGFTSANATVDFWYATTDLPLTVAGLNGVDFSNAVSRFGAQKIADDYGFVRGGSGTNDVIDIFGEGLAGESAFAADLLSGGVVTIIATSDSGVASWAGAVNIRDFADPTLTVSLVPAPGAVALLGLGGLAVARRRRSADVRA